MVEPPFVRVAHAHAHASDVRSQPQPFFHEDRRTEATIYTILDSPIHTHTATGGQGTANDPILVDINTPPQPDSPVKVVLGERYGYDDLCCASTFDLILYKVMFHH